MRLGAGRADGVRTPVPILAGWVLGALVSGYLTFEHVTSGATLVCAESGVVNCARVTTSAYSTLAGVPVAVLGLGYFLAGCGFAFVLERRLPAALGRGLGAGASGLGMAFVLYLVWAELVPLGQMCAWCTAVHLVAAALFVYYATRWLAALRQP